MSVDRRVALGALIAAAAGRPAWAARPLLQGVPLGLQLYLLGDLPQTDLDGALKATAAIGYQRVEMGSFYSRSPAEFRAALDRAGLDCRSAQVAGQSRGPGTPSLDGDLARLAADFRTVGVRRLFMTVFRFPEGGDMLPRSGETTRAFLVRIAAGMTADDWRRNAEFLNRTAAALQREGIALGYHNHNLEFARVGDTSGFEILLKETDPALVSFELDVGWAQAAGQDPARLLARSPGRYAALHVKDVKPTTRPNFVLEQHPAEVGAGGVDWSAVLRQALALGIREFYVEQEPPFEVPRLEAAARSLRYLRGLEA